MEADTLRCLDINLHNVGQIQTTKYEVIAIFDLDSNLILKLSPIDGRSLNELKLSLVTELRDSEDDPRKFINTANDDLIRASIIGNVSFVEDRGVAIYNTSGKLIYWFEEPNNNAIGDIVEQIEAYPNLPKEEWNLNPMADDPEDFIEPINWDIRLF